jgi:hypothetical protein
LVIDGECLIKSDAGEFSASLLITALARFIDEYASHELRCDGEEVSTIVPLNTTGIHESQVRLVNKGCCLQGMPISLTAHALPRETAQLVIDQGYKSLQRRVVSRPPLHEKVCDVVSDQTASATIRRKFAPIEVRLNDTPGRPLESLA